MQVGAGIEMLEISAEVMGRVNLIHPTLIWDEREAVLVDTGYPGQLSRVQAAMVQAGVPFGRLTRVILTHQDIDHIGGLPAIRQEMPGAEVLTSEGEKPYVQGDRMLLKMTPEAIARMVAALPPDLPEERRQAFRARFENPPRAKVDRTVADGEELSWCGGITVVSTPGHTPGHLCLYHRASGTLIAGDALNAREGQLLGPSPQYTADMASALQSLKKLAAFDIRQVICYHGGLYRGDVQGRIAELLQP